jgi:uncharacterized membrane protein
MTDAGNATTGASRRTPRWMLAALFVSLALNLLVVGSLAGAVWRHRGPPPMASVVIPNLYGYASTLVLERRKQLEQLTRDERNHIRPFRREVRAAREEAIKALVAQPFDRDRFVAAQARQAEAENRARSAVQDLYVKIADSLTPDERRAFPLWREHRRAPVRNFLDEPDQSAGEPSQPVK